MNFYEPNRCTTAIFFLSSQHQTASRNIKHHHHERENSAHIAPRGMAARHDHTHVRSAERQKQGSHQAERRRAYI